MDLDYAFSIKTDYATQIAGLSFLACVLPIFLQFTLKCTKKKTKYALFQIETEFDCLHKSDYSITDLGLQDRLGCLKVVVYSPVAH